MKLYVVTYSEGQWSDHVERISAIFDDEQKADLYKQKITDYFAKLEKIPNPFGELDSEDLDEEQQKLYYSWYWATDEARDFNSAYVYPFELNDEDLKFLQEPKINPE